MTHEIDLTMGRQTSRPIEIGRYCFIGTDCVVLGGSRLPDYSVLGAKSLLNKRFDETHWLYAGVPCQPIKRLEKSAEYFNRVTGVVH
jgi:acetyltransferase-like isoleucine patch superfamily enzyme